MPKPRKRLDREIEIMKCLQIGYLVGHEIEMTHRLFTDKFIVDLAVKSCT